MGRKPQLGQQLVYLHCRSIFVGEFTSIRDLNSIQVFLKQRRNAIPALFDGYPLEKVCLIAQKLLVDGIFSSEALARQRFPLLFDSARLMPSNKALPKKALFGKSSSEKSSSKEKSSSEKSSSEKPSCERSLCERSLCERSLCERSLCERSLCEQSLCVQSSSEKPSSVTEGSHINSGNSWAAVAGAQNRFGFPGSSAKSAEHAVNSDATEQHATDSSEVSAQVPPSTPLYLPYATQHRILNGVQTALEGSCFDFTEEFLSEVIKAQGLEVPEQLELTQWVLLLTQSASQLPHTLPAMGWEGCLSAAEKLQSTIARRTRTSVDGMISLLDDSMVITQSFKDRRRTAWCQYVCETLRSSLANIEEVEKDLREILSVQLQDIAGKRAKLDSMATQAIAHMMEVERLNRVYVCEAMKQVLLDLNTPGEKVPLISDGSEAVKINKEGGSNLKRNSNDKRIFDASAYNTSPKKRASRYSELQTVRQGPGKVIQADLVRKPSWDPKNHSFSTSLESLNSLSSKPVQRSQAISNAQTFFQELAAGMTAGSLSEKLPALLQKADLNGNVKSEPKTADNTLAMPHAARPPPFGSHDSHKENSSVWERARLVTLDSCSVQNACEPATV